MEEDIKKAVEVLKTGGTIFTLLIPYGALDVMQPIIKLFKK